MTLILTHDLDIIKMYRNAISEVQVVGQDVQKLEPEHYRQTDATERITRPYSWVVKIVVEIKENSCGYLKMLLKKAF